MEKETKHTPEGWIISEEDKKRIIDESVGSWKKYCEALKSHNDNSFTRDEVKSLMGIVHDSGQKEIDKLQTELSEMKKEREELKAENIHLKKRIDSDWYVRELNNELSEMKKQIDEFHNSIMTQWEKDYGSIHNEQKMDAYTLSGFIKSILSRIKK